MTSKIILLWSMPVEVMLVIEHASGVSYQNQVGGTACWQAALEGVLAPFDMSPKNSERIINHVYTSGQQGITVETADAIDAILASEPEAKFLRVDRDRLGQSWEAWIHVTVESPTSSDPDATPDFFGPSYGFGTTRGVLTWPNSD